MGKPAKIYVCTRGKKCPKRGSEKVLEELQAEIERQGAADSVEVKGCKCLDLCKKGPVVVVLPSKVKYGRVEKSDCAEIIKTHKAGEDTVERLVITKKKK